MRRLTSCFQRPSGNCHNLPKVATAVPRMPNSPLVSAPKSEDTAAGVRTARSARARRRPSASPKRSPVSLRPTTRRKRSFREKELRRANTVYRLNLLGQPSAVRKQRLFFPADDRSPLPCRPLEAGSAPPKNRERSLRKRRTICRHACACREYVPIPRPLSAT